MKKSSSKTRNRLPGLIKRAETEDERWTLARYGHGYSGSEIFRAVEQAVVNCAPSATRNDRERGLVEWAWIEAYGKAFLRAAVELNPKVFDDAARAVRFLKELKAKGGIQDPLRLVLLACKKASDGWREEELPATCSRQLRNTLLSKRTTSLPEFRQRFPRIVEHLSDRQIYRAANEVGFKFSDSRKGRS